MKNIILIIIVFAVLVPSCKPKVIPPEELTLSEILLLHQWRKTEKAIYNTNNELEEYLFTFEDAEDCEKNSYILFLSYYGELNMCTNVPIKQKEWKIINDTLFIYPFNSEGIIKDVYYRKHINYYDKANYILDYDTIINEENKKIKETYTAFPKN